MTKQILTFLLLITWTTCELPFIKKPKPPPQPPNCTPYTAQLTALLLFVCDNVNEDQAGKDACSGCFQRATTANNSQPSAMELRGCAQTYLVDSRYEECSSQIENDRGIGACITGYCKFVTCIRRVNSDVLIAQCYEQASADNDADFEEEQIILYKNITSCILARSRCASINPITGQRQTSSLTTTTYDKWGKPTTSTVYLYNALQITPQGNLRILQLPGNLPIQNHFCTNRANLQQTSWFDYDC